MLLHHGRRRFHYCREQSCSAPNFRWFGRGACSRGMFQWAASGPLDRAGTTAGPHAATPYPYPTPPGPLGPFGGAAAGRPRQAFQSVRPGPLSPRPGMPVISNLPDRTTDVHIRVSAIRLGLFIISPPEFRFDFFPRGAAGRRARAVCPAGRGWAGNDDGGEKSARAPGRSAFAKHNKKTVMPLLRQANGLKL